MSLKPAIGDLIDTLWNVKLTRWIAQRTFHLGFNRYIVECKASTFFIPYLSLLRI